ncbi:TadE/TadG family type IV pilus assembly protein [Qipengyuania sp. RANM35]|uniref:TadE/TadG family type IV pilus assembly protein n=1 Tax=Qipengyuania sp. RANM35 TaxID=3068635 RepID=UPI0034DB1C58
MIAGIARMLKRLRGDERGNLLLMAGAALTGLIGAAGIGVDTVQWYLWKRQMQQTVDTGATAGAIALSFGRDYDSSARSEIARTANTAYTVEAIRIPPTSGAYAGDTGAVEVIATTSRKLPFSSVFLATAPTIRTRAVATAVAVGDPCVLALATSGTGVEVFGSADVSLDCPVASNSPVDVSVDVGGSAFLDSGLILSVGGIDYSTGNLPADAAIIPYGLPVSDPLAGRDLSYSSASCNYTNYSVSPSQNVQAYGGVYCNGMKLQGTVRMHGGVYIIKSGTFQVNSGANISLFGDGGVTIILTGKNSNTVATVSINGDAKLDLRAPTSAENSKWAGILFYQDPMGSATHTFNGGADIDIEGIIYMPKGDVTYNGDATQNAQCLLLISERVRFGGTNNIENNCNVDIDPWAGKAKVVRVVE